MQVHITSLTHVLQAPDAVCLADYCDIFRCDIVSSRAKPSFWDTALCIEDDMSEMVEKCQVNIFSDFRKWWL